MKFLMMDESTDGTAAHKGRSAVPKLPTSGLGPRAPVRAEALKSTQL